MKINTYQLSVKSPMTGRWLLDYAGTDLSLIELSFSATDLNLKPFGEAVEFNVYEGGYGAVYKLACTGVNTVPDFFKVEVWCWPGQFIVIDPKVSQAALSTFASAEIIEKIIEDKMMIVRHDGQRHRVSLWEG